MTDSTEPIPPKPDADYLAANGHVMTTTEWKWNERRWEWIRVQWNADHSSSCQCNGLEPLPEW